MNATETIRAAARLMRERAETACPAPWFITADSSRYGGVVAKPTADYPEHQGYSGHLIGESLSPEHREYVASWAPNVALAVADWLDSVADRADAAGITGDLDEPHALAVTRAYLDAFPTGTFPYLDALPA